MEDDSSSDSDYCPENDGEESLSDHGGDEDKGIIEITAGRKRKAYSAFDDLRQQDESETKAKMSNALPYKDLHKLSTGKSSSAGSQKKKRKVIDKYNEMLASVFGVSAPKKKKSDKAISSKSAKKNDISSTHSEKQDVVSSGIDNSGTIESPDDIEKIRLAALEVAKQVLKKTKVVETKKFAGRDITVTKSTLGTSSSSSNTANGSSIASSSAAVHADANPNLDSVLDALKGPKAISTVSKSSSDWSNFKEEEGLEDTLMHAGKDGYLTKQEFLDRCDYRAFEKERDQRLQQAATRAALP